MKVLIVGEKSYINEFIEHINDEGHFIDVYFWNFEFGPELLLDGRINEYEAIVVACKDENKSAKLRDLIVQFANLPASHILDFNKIYKITIPFMRVDAVMQNPNYSSYETMVMGISHAEVGILSNRLKKATCNIAVTSQDIYYDLKALEYAVKNYWNKIKDIKNIVLDMYDFNYFNFDVSKSKAIFMFLNAGGYNLDEHNILENQNFRENLTINDYKEYLAYKNYSGVDAHHIEIWQMLFSNVYKMNNYQDFMDYFHIDNRLEIYDVKQTETSEGYVCDEKHRYEDTVNENVKLFNELLDFIYKTWPDVKLTLITLPISKAWKDIRSSSKYESWEKEYMDIIAKANEKYPFIFKSYFDHEICDDLRYFNDKEHLNYVGAVEFTRILEKDFLE